MFYHYVIPINPLMIPDNCELP